MRTKTLVAALLAAGMALSACSGGGGPLVDGSPTPEDPREATSAGTATTPTEAAPTTGGEPEPDCPQLSTWDLNPDEEAGHSSDRLFRVRTGQHDCFDRVVFDIDGTDKPGALVRYVPVVRADGSGTPYPVAGGAALEVIVRASISGYPDGPGTLGPVGNRLYPAAELSGWRTLREVRFAGFFEGQSTVAVGVRENLPFRAFTLVDSDAGVSKLVVDIAHGF